jgi:hypothetical protein
VIHLVDDGGEKRDDDDREDHEADEANQPEVVAHPSARRFVDPRWTLQAGLLGVEQRAGHVAEALVGILKLEHLTILTLTLNNLKVQKI